MFFTHLKIRIDDLGECALDGFGVKRWMTNEKGVKHTAQPPDIHLQSMGRPQSHLEYIDIVTEC